MASTPYSDLAQPAGLGSEPAAGTDALAVPAHSCDRRDRRRKRGHVVRGEETPGVEAGGSASGDSQDVAPQVESPGTGGASLEAPEATEMAGDAGAEAASPVAGEDAPAAPADTADGEAVAEVGMVEDRVAKVADELAVAPDHPRAAPGDRTAVLDTDHVPMPDADRQSGPDADHLHVPDTEREPAPDVDRGPVSRVDAAPAPDHPEAGPGDRTAVLDTDHVPVPDADRRSAPDTDHMHVPGTEREPAPDVDREPVSRVDAAPAPDHPEAVPGDRTAVLDTDHVPVPDADRQSAPDADHKQMPDTEREPAPDVDQGPVSRVDAAPAPVVAPAPAPPPVRPTSSIGSIDHLEHDEISGWVWNPETPDEPADIEILDDDVVVLKVRAEQFRRDLLGAGVGNGRHGFVLRHLAGVLPLSRHRVRVRRASDGRDLPGSPAWIIRPGLDDRAIDFMDQAVASALEVATRPDDLAQPLSHVLRLLNELVNAYETLSRNQKEVRQIPVGEIADGLRLTDRMRELVDRLQYAHAPLFFEPSDEPVVSVIIPVHNKFSYTYDCLRSIHQTLPKHAFEIIIVDDCSDDETGLAALVFSGGVRIVRNASNLGFVGTCNAGAAGAKGRYLFFLNNDTLMQEGWLDELVETFEQVRNVGIVGSQLLFPNGKLQEAGGIVWRLGDAWNWGRNRDPSEPMFCYLRDADYVSGAALMIERALFRELGGFDELFAPAYYEDTDLAFRVRARGKRVVVQPASKIVHLEGVSAGTDTAGSGMKRYQAINHGKFYQRWKDTLITHRFNGQHPELEAERLVQKRAYFIDDTVPTPDQDAGSNAAVAHMRLLMELGYNVVFLPADTMAKIDPYTGQLQKLGIECQYHPFRWSVEEVFRKATHKPDLVYLHRYANASKYATMVRRYFPECRIVYSVADLHFLRMERQAAIEGSAASAAAAMMQRRAEMTAMQSVDCVIVHSPFEAKLLREAEPALKVEVVPWTVRPRPTTVAFADRSGIAFVGGFGHPPNVDAAHYLTGDILPLLRRQLPNCKTYLIGSNMPDEVAKLQVPGLVVLGFVPVLADILHKLRCSVVPLRYGAGIKGKVLESFAHGLPCVMSESAAEGLELPDELAWLVARSPEEFAEKLARVHEDAAFNRTLSEAGLAYIEQRNSASTVKEALKAAVAG